MKRVSPEVLAVLDAVDIDGLIVRITADLVRALYLEVNKVLEALGGKWDRKARGHVFEEDPVDAIDQAVVSGEYTDRRQELQFFETPPALAERLVELADIQPGMLVLEPSAGRGRIVSALLALGAKVSVVEIDPNNFSALARMSGVNVVGPETLVRGNFLDQPPAAVFDRVVMNPPFSRQQDIAHVMHAFRFLAPGGILVAVMSAGTVFRSNKRAVEFREFLAQHKGVIEPLPDGSFLPATGVRTCVVFVAKPERPE